MDDLKKKTIGGIKWNLRNQFFVQGINFISAIFLIRLLSPEDFGLIAMVLVVLGFLQLMREMGLSSAIIQKKEVGDKELSSIFWVQIILTIILAALLVSSSSMIQGYYNEVLLHGLILFFAVDLIIGSVGLVPTALLKKELRFKELFYIHLIAIISSSGIGIILALNGWNYWSLAAKLILWTTVNSVLVWFFIKWKPQISCSLSSMKKLWSFGLPLSGNNVLNYLVRNLDDLLVGRVLGEHALGLYNRAYAIMLLPVNNVSKVIAEVLFPALSKIEDEKTRSGKIYLRTISSVALFTFPAGTMLFICADQFVHLVMGEKWLGAIKVIQILSLLGIFQSIGTFTGTIFVSQGKTNLLLKVGIFEKLFIISMIVFGIYYTRTIEGVALYYTIASLLALFFGWYFMKQLVGISIGAILRTLSLVFWFALSMGISIYLLKIYLLSGFPMWLSFLVLIFAGTLIYYFLISIFKIKALADARELARFYKQVK